jgi:tRNA G18 (ribose-2'-O)-methylase SpoU
VVTSADALAVLSDLSTKGLVAVGASEHEGESWGDVALRSGVALVLGNEARGLSQDVAPHIRRWVNLPMRGKAESLNVSVAGGVLMYQWLRLNHAPA